jgi:hypothetical protein
MFKNVIIVLKFSTLYSTLTEIQLSRARIQLTADNILEHGMSALNYELSIINRSTLNSY